MRRDALWFEKNYEEIYRLSKSPDNGSVLSLEKNRSISLSFLEGKLLDFGYEKTAQITFPGEFSQRGGLIDVFPINSRNGFRLEFFGNRIENISPLFITIPDEKRVQEILNRKLKTQKLFSGLKNLKPGDYIVHSDHGVARFLGTVKYEADRVIQDYYALEYAEDDKLYVPLGLERKLSRYIGLSEPKITRLGSNSWENTKKKIKEDVEKFARELLQIYSQREVTLRPPWEFDDEIEKRLQASFPFEETADQLLTLKEIKKDLSKSRPMDRLVCGDVGFGKTEVALRTMAQAAANGYQAAFLCPTTILANQHFQNFKERLKDLPIRLALLTRLQTKKEQREITENLKFGKIDVVIATHRLLSKDIEQSIDRLGLLVIDDEQRFGVKQKERLKKLRASLDILSLSATPIPRTLHLALSSLREMSLIQTSPQGRQPIKTFVLPFGEKTVVRAIRDETGRNGQTYYLHNRIATIEKTKDLLEKLCPRLRIGIIHGRMKEREMIKTMADFQTKKTNLLLATIIIENGLDLPNVNTLIVEDASRLGLSQAYQIRGRIGRFHQQAFAYFLHPNRLLPLAKERLKALKEAQELGSGWQIALRDLEIRGAGNILGKEQSGNINRIGLNLYCQMLSDAVEKQR